MSQGRIIYHVLANPNENPYTSTADPAAQAFIRNHVYNIGTYTPYFDSKLAWMPRASVYFDSYAIHTNDPLVAAHPEWILKDALGNNLFIPWECANGTCPQFAGDISNSDFRGYMIDQIQKVLSPGYTGLWLDDVNLAMRVSDGNGNQAFPIKTSTNTAMTPTEWAAYFAEYVSLIRASLPPSIDITHNSIWYALAAPSTRQQISSASYIYLERGFGDTGITGGTGAFSLATFMNFIDTVHALGTSVIIGEYSVADLSFATACYLLTNDGHDMIGFDDLPLIAAGWPSILSANLGASSGQRFQHTPGVWCRNFDRGQVYVNEPGAPPTVITLQSPMFDYNGNEYGRLPLPARSGCVLLYEKS